MIGLGLIIVGLGIILYQARKIDYLKKGIGELLEYIDEEEI